jgi:hypothetical protein
MPPPYFLFSLYRLSAVPSFLVCVGAGAALAASLLDLYRMSGVPSFFVFVPLAEVVAGFAADAVDAGFAVDAVEAGSADAVVAGLVTELVDAGFFDLAGVAWAGVAWAREYRLKPISRKEATNIFFIIGIFVSADLLEQERIPKTN